MPIVRISPHHSVIDLAPNTAIGPDGSGHINLSAHLHLRIAAQGKPATYVRAFPNLGVFAQVYRPVYGAEGATFRISAVFRKKIIANNSISAAHGFTGAAFSK